MQRFLGISLLPPEDVTMNSKHGGARAEQQLTRIEGDSIIDGTCCFILKS